MLPGTVIDLRATYQRLARPWTHEQLADHYLTAKQHREHGSEDPEQGVLSRPISALATAIPSSASLSVAIHVLHVLPDTARSGLAEQLLDTAEENAADVMHRCHRALERDGRDHDYTADEWLPVVYDVAAPLLESARLDLDREPPSVVQHVQDGVRWLASAIVNLDRDSAETPTALTDTLARLLATLVFVQMARDLNESRTNSRSPGGTGLDEH
jgi:GNAT superfamily N-acetyltransferase